MDIDDDSVIPESVIDGPVGIIIGRKEGEKLAVGQLFVNAEGVRIIAAVTDEASGESRTILRHWMDPIDE